jgi:hypothetical protein
LETTSINLYIYTPIKMSRKVFAANHIYSYAIINCMNKTVPVKVSVKSFLVRNQTANCEHFNKMYTVQIQFIFGAHKSSLRMYSTAIFVTPLVFTLFS